MNNLKQLNWGVSLAEKLGGDSECLGYKRFLSLNGDKCSIEH